VEYDKSVPDRIKIHVPETVCTLASGEKYTVRQQVLIRRVLKPARNMKRVMYLCEKCKKLFFEKVPMNTEKGIEEKVQIAVDHISPIVDPCTGFVDWNTYFARMFPGDNGLQLLCGYPGEVDGKKSCHNEKTAIERSISAERERMLSGKKAKENKTKKKQPVKVYLNQEITTAEE
jgi:uncharacterized protein YlzI (FlbEa/FlbD family)